MSHCVNFTTIALLHRAQNTKHHLFMQKKKIASNATNIESKNLFAHEVSNLHTAKHTDSFVRNIFEGRVLLTLEYVL